MGGLVEIVAPRTWSGALARALAIVAVIHAINFAASGAVPGLAYSISDCILTTCIATPQIFFMMAMLRHQRRLQHEMTLLATTDMLTGLPSRRAFMARTAAATEGGQAGALLLLDADHFKRINDGFGHAAGDACLRAIGDHLRAALTPGDIVGRVGGEEFSIFLPGATRARAAALGERLCRAVAVEAASAEWALRVTLSVGAALTEAGAPLDRLMARADRALYRAKAEGRARMVIWPEGEIAGEGEPATGPAGLAARPVRLPSAGALRHGVGEPARSGRAARPREARVRRA